MDFWNQPRNILFLSLIFSLLVPLLGICGSEGWSKYDDYDGISMYRKEVPGNPVLAYRGEGVLQAPIEKLLTVLLDTAKKPQWMSRVRGAEVLREISPFEKIEFVHVKTPWILKDREFIYRVKVTLDQRTWFATIHYESVDDPLRPESTMPRRHSGFMRPAHAADRDDHRDERKRIECEAHGLADE